MFKFLHAADIHLDSPQKGLDRYEGAPVEECRGSTRRALENLVRLAAEEAVAFVLISGDLYDGDWPDFNTGLFFSRQMNRLGDWNIPVFLIRGNHDAQNRMTHDLRLPRNVTGLDPRSPQTVYLDDLGVAIHGQSYATWDLRDNLAKAYPQGVRNLFNIGMLHTGVDGSDTLHKSYAPCSLDDMKFREYDYWALGHIHQRKNLVAADPLIAFPGNIQGRDVGEHGAKGCLLVTVDGTTIVAAEPRWLDVMRWETCRLDASGAEDADEILQRFHDRVVRELPGAEDRMLALRVEVHGPCRAHSGVSSDWPLFSSEVRRAATEAGGGRVWVEKVVAKTRPPADDRPALDDGPLAELLAFLDELRGDDDRLKDLGGRSLDDLKAKVPPDLLDGLDTPERLRDLLDQVGPMLLDRLGACTRAR